MKKKVTRSLGRNLHNIPNNSIIYEVNINLSNDQLNKLTIGISPMNMEDKWFIFEEEKYIYMYRSWTGIFISRLQIKTISKPRIVSIEINSDPKQFKSLGKKEDIKLIIEELNNSFNMTITQS